MIQRQALAIKLKNTDINKAEYERIANSFNSLCNYISAWIYRHSCETNTSVIKAKLKQRIKEKYKLLQVSDIDNAICYVACQYKNKMKQNQILLPAISLAKPISFNRPRYYFSIKKWNALSKQYILVFTLKHRIKVNCSLEQLKSLQNGQVQYGLLIKVDQNWYFVIYINQHIKENDNIFFDKMVSVNFYNLFDIHCYDGIKMSSFQNQSALLKLAHYRQLLCKLKKKNTKSSRRKLRKTALKEKRWLINETYVLVSKIIKKYKPNTLFLVKTRFSQSLNIEMNLSLVDYAWILFKFKQVFAEKVSKYSDGMVEVNTLAFQDKKMMKESNALISQKNFITTCEKRETRAMYYQTLELFSMRISTKAHENTKRYLKIRKNVL